MSGRYRGVVKVGGSLIRGWLIDTARPDRRIRFNLVIDGELRGTYAANRRRRFLVRQSGASEDTHGFSIPIRKAWITGAKQEVRLEDPGDPALDVRLVARLGPSARAHFQDHVVAGQISIGGTDGEDTPPRPARRGEDDVDQEVRPVFANRALLRQIGALDDADLISLLITIERDIVLGRLEAYEKSGDWHSASPFRRVVLGGAAGQILSALARGALKAHSNGLAARLAAAAAALHPQSFEPNLLAGRAKSAQGEFDEAMRYLRAAERLDEDGVRARREMVLAITRQLRGTLSADRRRELNAEYLSLLRILSASANAATRMAYRVPFATALYSAGRYDEALAVADEILSASPLETRTMMIKARALVALNRIAEAQALYGRILELDPSHGGARMNLRVLSALAEDEALHRDGASGSVAALHGMAVPDRVLADWLSGLDHDWICTTHGFADETVPPDIEALLQVHAARRLGYVEVGLGDGRRLEFWRRAALLGLAESELLATLDDAVALNRWKPFYAAREQGPSPAASRNRRGIVALISRNGGHLYGGGEHFLENVAEHHSRQGFEPVIVGMRAELNGERRMLNSHRCVFLGESAAELRAFVLENDVALVHAISGTGFAVAEALNYTNIPFIYGVHFWNEMLGDPQDTAYFDDTTGRGRFRREFQVILSRATAIYANSRYTQKLIEEGFGVRCPVLFPVPPDRPRHGPEH